MTYQLDPKENLPCCSKIWKTEYPNPFCWWHFHQSYDSVVGLKVYWCWLIPFSRLLDKIPIGVSAKKFTDNSGRSWNDFWNISMKFLVSLRSSYKFLSFRKNLPPLVYEISSSWNLGLAVISPCWMDRCWPGQCLALVWARWVLATSLAQIFQPLVPL